ncbi:MAG TPA: ATP-binding cassette domain-containing protein [Leptospiraceae bacterium]|nr:ATP-binding cassette domain-containing protein [Leptospiraceae bacterium]
MNLIEIKNLSIMDSSRRNILKDFSFELRKDSIHAVIGESGSGKTSFANTLFHLTKKDLNLKYESYSIFGKDYSDYRESDWVKMRGKQITMIPQSPGKSFHPYISIGSQILDYFKNKEPNLAQKDSILSLLEQVQIRNPEAAFHSLPKNLSGGEKQRILVAMAIAVKPEIVVADEPTTALDSINEKLTLNLLYTLLKNSGIGLVLITHDMRIVRELADDVTVLRSGELIEKITLLNKNMNKLQSEYSQKLVSKSL